MTQWFNNLRTRAKLFLSFSLLLIMMSLIVYVGYSGIRTVNESQKRLNDNMLFVVNGFSIQNEVDAQSELMRAIVSMPVSLKDQLMDEIRGSDKKIDQSFQLLKELPLKKKDDSTAEIVEEWESLWKAFKSTRETEIFPAIYANHLAKAQKLINADNAERYEKMVKIADSLLEQNEQEANRLTAASSRRYTDVLFLFTGVMLCAVALVIALAVLLGHVIARPLHEMAVATGRVAAGDFSIALTAKGNDEVGNLARSFSKMIVELRRTQTEQRKAEQALKEAMLRTETINEQLAQANLALAQKNEENEMFVYSISHDLRSPLVNLMGFSKELSRASHDLRNQLIKTSLSQEVQAPILALVDEEMAESIRFIQSGVARLNIIMNALLKLSRTGKLEYQSYPVDLKPMVVRIVESMRNTIGERNADVLIKDLPEVWGDPAALEQIFSNLIGNALNYLDPARPGRVEVGSLIVGEKEGKQDSMFNTYFVRDNGLGIPENSKSEIFQLFRRFHPDRATGEGVGLAVVRRIIERHGGRIWFDSTEGIGTTFFMKLPKTPSKQKT